MPNESDERLRPLDPATETASEPGAEDKATDKMSPELRLRWEGEKLMFAQARLMEQFAREAVEEALFKQKPPVRKKRPRSFTKREKVIRAAIRARLTGPEYAAYLDDHKILTHEKWQNSKDKPCPRKHVEAYKDPYWRGLIQQEKSRVGNRK